jgi:DNA repair protein RadC
VPDSDDVEAMASLGAAAALVGVSVLDHVILGEDGFASMLRLGLLPPGPRDPRYR